MVALIGFSISLVGCASEELNGPSDDKKTSTEIKGSTDVTQEDESTTNEDSGSKAKENSSIQESETPSNPNFVSAKVTRVVDGDTMKINLNGKEETIRLLLVDTPETKAPNTPVQQFGPEASAFAQETLTGKQVQLEYDGPKRDKYDRLLVYLWIGNQTFNEMLLEGGYARLAYVYDPPYTHYKAYMKAQNRAKDGELGIWNLDNYVHEDGFYYQDNESSTTSVNDTYKNCSAVRKANADPIHKGEPGFGSHLDGDGDGIACE
ncbi:nuclease [Aquibacillus halophilus]|uniref:Nuclease n=2 Tax=Aquibacillus halophilus TaxID=930132 RepID=A0A6A8DEA1_9BACI|nr:nuclease [Aquibacillus halophilus]